MRRLKVITTTFVIFGVLLLFGFPFVFAMRPGPSAAQRDRQIFALTITGYFFLICIVLGVIMILAWKLFWSAQYGDALDHWPARPGGNSQPEASDRLQPGASDRLQPGAGGRLQPGGSSPV